MLSFDVFVRLAAIPATGFLVFLNFLHGVPPQPFPQQGNTAPVTTVSYNSVPSSPVGGTAQMPSPRDRTVITTLPSDIRSLRVPAGTPAPFPTNAWWSSGSLEPWPAPVFAWPLKISIAANGVEAVWPETSIIPTAVMQNPSSIFALRPQNETLAKARILRWGDWDVTFRVERSGGQPAYDVTAVQGSPFVFLRSYGVTYTAAVPPGSVVRSIACSGACGGAVLVSAPLRSYLLTVSAGDSIDVQGLSVTVRSSGVLSIAAVAPGTSPESYLPYALSVIEGTRAEYAVSSDRIQTTFTAPARTLMGLLPHQSAALSGSPGRLIGSYDTVRGTIDAYDAQSFTTSLQRPALLPGLPPVVDAGVVTQLRADIPTIPPAAIGDVYNGGKQVLRGAQLADLAAASGDTALAADALNRATALLADWCTAEPGSREGVLAYDRELGGLVPLPPAYGSEHYNDHHFHAGYFIAAGAILARLDSSFAREYGDCMNLFIRDIASPDRRDPSFPYLRFFDVYAGHSWANGLTLFADAQNQESTSEALQAWHGIALWGRITGDRAIEDLGVWLLAQEAAGTHAYWFNALPGRRTLPSAFSKPMISILWSGKADYATFFDANPAAIHGIQFFPVTTALLPVVTSSILDSLVLPLRSGNPPTIWSSGMMLVGALAGDAKRVPASDPLDPVLSRSYADHWVSSLSGLGAYQSGLRGADSCGAVFARGGSRTAVMYRFPGMPASCTFTDERTGARATAGNLYPGWNVRPL